MLEVAAAGGCLQPMQIGLAGPEVVMGDAGGWEPGGAGLGADH